jgi:hypothetical protein
VLFCARIGKANNAIAKVQNATGFKQAILGGIRMTAIIHMLYLFFADCRLSVGGDFLQIFDRINPYVGHMKNQQPPRMERLRRPNFDPLNSMGKDFSV